MVIRHGVCFNRDSQYTDDLTTSGSKVGSILQEVFLSYKNVLAVRSRWSQMWVWEACFTFCDNMIIVYLYIMIFVYLHNMIFVYFDQKTCGGVRPFGVRLLSSGATRLLSEKAPFGA